MSRATRIELLVAAVVGLVLLLVIPLVVELFALLEITAYIIAAILAISLGLVWGYGGILCFGQAAFYGLGGYTYAIAAFNMGDSTVPFLLSIAVPAGVAAVLGYVMFYGRLSDVYVGVMTLVVTLIFFKFINHTAGAEWRIGDALLGGFNGIPAIPPINVPGDPTRMLFPEDLYYLCGIALLVCYFGLRALLASHFGRVVVAIRENELRAELLGYDARLYKLIVFAIGGGIAGLAGCLFANWGAFVSPNLFSLAQTAQIIIWVLVGGLGTLIGPIVGAIALGVLTTQLGTQTILHNNLVMGAILIAFVLLVPRGLVPSIAQLWRRLVPLLPERRSRPAPRPRFRAAAKAPAEADGGGSHGG